MDSEESGGERDNHNGVEDQVGELLAVDEAREDGVEGELGGADEGVCGNGEVEEAVGVH